MQRVSTLQQSLTLMSSSRADDLERKMDSPTPRCSATLPLLSSLVFLRNSPDTPPTPLTKLTTFPTGVSVMDCSFLTARRVLRL